MRSKDFIRRRPRHRNIFEQTTLVSFIDESRDGELIGVEMPRKLLTWIENVGRQTGEWIGVAMNSLRFETLPQEIRNEVATKEDVNGKR